MNYIVNLSNKDFNLTLTNTDECVVYEENDELYFRVMITKVNYDILIKELYKGIMERFKDAKVVFNDGTDVDIKTAVEYLKLGCFSSIV